jgi:hypothetical protein
VTHATKGMVAHQNYRFPGVASDRGGLLIDYDKDNRVKRNRAYEKGKGVGPQGSKPGPRCGNL